MHDAMPALGYFTRPEKNPSVEGTVRLLTDYRMKEIKVVKAKNALERGLPEDNVIAVGESVGHIFRVAKLYVAEVKKLGSDDSQYAHIAGGRNDDYLMIMTRSVAVHLVTVDAKEDHDIEDMLVNLPTQEELKEHVQEAEEAMPRKIKRPDRKWARKVKASEK